MKRLLSSLLTVLGGTLGCTPRGLPKEAPGTLSDIEPHLDRLIRGRGPQPVLVVEVEGTDRFIQFSFGSDSIEMDFPLITEIQQRREDAIRVFCESRGLRWKITKGTDGARFLDCYLPPVAGDAAVVVRAAFRELFGVDVDDPLVFRGQGLAE